jgi:hypothetical protein
VSSHASFAPNPPRRDTLNFAHSALYGPTLKLEQTRCVRNLIRCVKSHFFWSISSEHFNLPHMILKKAIFLEIKKLPVTHIDAEKTKADRKTE